jgi:hypothetical protein
MYKRYSSLTWDRLVKSKAPTNSELGPGGRLICIYTLIIFLLSFQFHPLWNDKDDGSKIFFQLRERPITSDSSDGKKWSYCYHLSCTRLFISSFIFRWWITDGSRFCVPRKILSKLITPIIRIQLHAVLLYVCVCACLWRLELLEPLYTISNLIVSVCASMCVCACGHKKNLFAPEKWDETFLANIYHTWYTRSSNGQTNDTPWTDMVHNWVKRHGLESRLQDEADGWLLAWLVRSIRQTTLFS